MFKTSNITVSLLLFLICFCMFSSLIFFSIYLNQTWERMQFPSPSLPVPRRFFCNTCIIPRAYLCVTPATVSFPLPTHTLTTFLSSKGFFMILWKFISPRQIWLIWGKTKVCKVYLADHNKDCDNQFFKNVEDESQQSSLINTGEHYIAKCA